MLGTETVAADCSEIDESARCWPLSDVALPAPRRPIGGGRDLPAGPGRDEVAPTRYSVSTSRMRAL